MGSISHFEFVAMAFEGPNPTVFLTWGYGMEAAVCYPVGDVCDLVPGKGPHLQDRCSWSEGCLMRW